MGRKRSRLVTRREVSGGVDWFDRMKDAAQRRAASSRSIGGGGLRRLSAVRRFSVVAGRFVGPDERSQTPHSIKNSVSDSGKFGSAALTSPIRQSLFSHPQVVGCFVGKQQVLIVQLHSRGPPLLEITPCRGGSEPRGVEKLSSCRGRQALPSALCSVDQLRRRHQERGTSIFRVGLG